MYPKLPSLPRKHGGFHGPQSGMVIQLIRSQVKGNELLSGSVGVGFDDKRIEMKPFVENIWKILRKLTPKKIVQVDPKTREIQFARKDIRLGIDAYRWCKEDDARFLRFENSDLIYMRPAD